MIALLGIIHADLKPDNLLMSQNKTEIKARRCLRRSSTCFPDA